MERHSPHPKSLPQPLARVQAALHDESDDPRSQHAIAFAVFETVARWFAILLLKARADLQLPMDEGRRVQAFLRRPSFGNWVEILLRHGSKLPEGHGDAPAYQILEAIQKLLNGESMAAAELHAALRSPQQDHVAPTSSRPWHKLFEQLPSYRNDFIGHSGYVGDQHFQRFGPLLHAAGEALLAEAGLNCHPVRLCRPLQEGFQILEYPGGVQETVATHVPLPEGAEAMTCYLAAENSQDCLLSLGDLVAEEKGLLYLFDRSPARGGNEYIDFATGARLRRSGVSVAKGQLARLLSVESHEAGERLTVKGRTEIHLQPLRRSARVGEPVPFRFVVWNRGPAVLQCHTALEADSGGNWSFAQNAAVQLEIPVAGLGRALLFAVPTQPGVVEAPRARVSTSYDPEGVTELVDPS
ncbi:MAG: hypothetical protein V3T77_07980, partial [Planctomycetota bacterium]